MNQFQINPSILSADFARLGDDVQFVLDAGADCIHFDVMDNHYVPNLTFGALILSALREYGIQAKIDVHLMVEPVDALIEDFLKAGADSIVFHPDATRHIDRTLKLIKSYGIDAGLALNPATDIDCLEYVLDSVDRVLLMSVNPGFGGQKFIDKTLDKAQKLSKWLASKNRHDVMIEIDGGVGVGNIKKIAQSGVRAFVAGSSIFNSNDYKNTISQMRAQLIGI